MYLIPIAQRAAEFTAMQVSGLEAWKLLCNYDEEPLTWLQDDLTLVAVGPDGGSIEIDRAGYANPVPALSNEPSALYGAAPDDASYDPADL